MTEVDILGAGVWSERFAGWDEFRRVLGGEDVESGGALQPALIPARERRRAPAAVKMAVEVMDQACKMAGLDPMDVATVFGSGMCDMQITDYICRVLADNPRLVSPTKFHNSVHNAATGYWSIATGSHASANAICAHANTVAAALVEGAVQAAEEDRPVLIAIEELAAPQPFRSVIDVDKPLGAALLVAPRGYSAVPLSGLQLEFNARAALPSAASAVAGLDFRNNFAAPLLPLMAALARRQPFTGSLPLCSQSSLAVALVLPTAARTAQA